MAYSFRRASFRYLSAAAPAQGVPMTLAAMFYCETLTATNAILAVGQANATHRHRISVNSSGAFSALSSGFTSGTTSALGISATATGQVLAGRWYHGAMTAESNSRVAYLDGVAATANTTSFESFNNFDYTHISSQFSNSIFDYMDGEIAEVGIWSAALTGDEIRSLSRGCACKNVRPESLVFYAPLVRNLVDVRGGAVITNNNAATVANHPRVFA